MQPHAQRHCGPHVQAARAALPWQPHLQVEPGHELHAHEIFLASLIRVSFDVGLERERTLRPAPRADLNEAANSSRDSETSISDGGIPIIRRLVRARCAESAPASSASATAQCAGIDDKLTRGFAIDDIRGGQDVRRIMTGILGLAAAAWITSVHADTTVLAVRLGANDVVALAKFYDAAFGLKEIDRVGQPATEIIMRYGATVAAAKAGSSPEFLVQKREAGTAKDTMAHAIFRVADVAATVAAAKAAGATMNGDVVTVPIGGMPVKIATLVDPDGNLLEVMELAKGAEHLPHP